MAPLIVEHANVSLGATAFACRWVPRAAKAAVACAEAGGDGSLRALELRDGRPHEVARRRTASALKCLAFSGRAPVAGDFAGALAVYDAEFAEVTRYARAHSGLVNCADCVDAGDSAPEIATGGRDGSVKVWDARQGERPVFCAEPAAGETRRDCWAVGFGDSYGAERAVAAGYDNGDVKMFDLRAARLRWECNLGNGVCGLEFDRRDVPMNKLVATTLEGKFHAFDTRTLHPKRGFAQVVHKDEDNSTVWTCRHLPQNRDLFATCSGNGRVSLWQYSYPDKRSETDINGSAYGVTGTLVRLQRTQISTQPINSLDWCADKIGLAICTSFDQCLRVLIATQLNLY